MRVLLQARLGTQHASDAVQSGEINQVMDHVLSETKAEAAYFGVDPTTGQRCAYIVCDLNDPSRLPSLLEPMFRTLHASITFTPVMNQEELIQGLQSIKK